MNKRRFFKVLFSVSVLFSIGWAWILKNLKKPNDPIKDDNNKTSENSMIKTIFPLDFQWPTFEPFLFCVHHYDRYPSGNGQYGPDQKYLKGRMLGEDFQEKDGFRMYHGESVPGFPVHPHRGFETVTIVRKGYVDHADSLGAAGRYGQGDVQWMTAGRGVQHSEMFPLLKNDESNTVELFQIWLNLPKKNKMVPAHFKMLWSEKIPVHVDSNSQVKTTVIAGDFLGLKPPAPPPDSWAANDDAEVKILLVKIPPHQTFKLDKSNKKVNRAVYFFEGQSLLVNNQKLNAKSGALVQENQDLNLQAESSEVEVLILQAAPIGEPVVQHGPFVMNSKEEIYQTFQDYQQTHFGGWSWPRHDMVHGPVIERFAKYPDGKIEKPV